MKREERLIEIDLMYLFRVLWDNLKYIIIATIFFGIIGYCGSKFLISNIYEADAKMIVDTRSNSEDRVTNDQLNSAKNLVDTYAIIIRSRDVLNQVISELNLQESYEELRDNIKVKAVDNTQVMQVVVQHTDIDTAYEIVKKITEISPTVIMNTVEAGSVKLVEKAGVKPNPVYPSNSRNAILIALIGFVLSCFVIVIIALLDNTYKSDLDIQNDMDLPVLGVIPAVENFDNMIGCPRKERKQKNAQ